MKTLILTLLIFLTGCASKSPISGTWSSIKPFGDSYALVTADITFTSHNEEFEGEFVFTSIPEKAKKALGATKFKLESIKFDGKNLTFLLPIIPSQPEESVIFTLVLDAEKLTGTLKENNPQAKKNETVEFAKK